MFATTYHLWPEQVPVWPAWWPLMAEANRLTVGWENSFDQLFGCFLFLREFPGTPRNAIPFWEAGPIPLP